MFRIKRKDKRICIKYQDRSSLERGKKSYSSLVRHPTVKALH